MTYAIIITLINTTLRMATPLILAAIGGVLSERSGVMNIALEGIMLMGAFGGVFGSFYTGNMMISILAAMLAGALLAGILAYVCINHRANQVVVGTAINMLSSGLLGFLLLEIWGQAGRSPMVEKVNPINFTFLQKMPVVGSLFEGLNIFVYLALLLVPAAHIVLFKTSLGLRIRAVGEHPKGAETAGINVKHIRYICVISSGILAGLAGAYLSIGELGMFTNHMSAGRGFIAMAAMIFGKWRPFGALKACLMFGAAEALQMVGQVLGWPIPKDILIAFPYILTIVVLAGFVGRASAPASIGKPYP